jgi:hypothetical protein
MILLTMKEDDNIHTDLFYADKNNGIFVIFVYIYASKISFTITMKSILFVGIIAALTIVATTMTASFRFILATAQTTIDNTTRGGGENMTISSNTTTSADEMNKTGSVSGVERFG